MLASLVPLEVMLLYPMPHVQKVIYNHHPLKKSSGLFLVNILTLFV